MDASLRFAKQIQELFPPSDEGTRLHRDLGNLFYEIRHPSDPQDRMKMNDVVNRLTLTIQEIYDYAKTLLPDPLITQAIRSFNEAKTGEDRLNAIDLLLQHARKLHKTRKQENEPQLICLAGDVSYNPSSHEVFFGGKVASNPRANSKERTVWRLMHDSTASPKRVTFEQLRRAQDDRGNLLFPILDESITSDIDKWNKKFSKFGISVLHKDGDSILLKELPLANKKHLQ